MIWVFLDPLLILDRDLLVLDEVTARVDSPIFAVIALEMQAVEHLIEHQLVRDRSGILLSQPVIREIEVSQFRVRFSESTK
jgi:hypothetical protein